MFGYSESDYSWIGRERIIRLELVRHRLDIYTCHIKSRDPSRHLYPPTTTQIQPLSSQQHTRFHKTRLIPVTKKAKPTDDGVRLSKKFSSNDAG
jgi:hypothetical protein